MQLSVPGTLTVAFSYVAALYDAVNQPEKAKRFRTEFEQAAGEAKIAAK
jgi:hypothetical protein